jgi:hypothetical protein
MAPKIDKKECKQDNSQITGKAKTQIKTRQESNTKGHPTQQAGNRENNQRKSKPPKELQKLKDQRQPKACEEATKENVSNVE